MRRTTAACQTNASGTRPLSFARRVRLAVAVAAALLSGAHNALAAMPGAVDHAIRGAAFELAEFIKSQGGQSVVPQFKGMLGMPGGGGSAFVEKLKRHLAEHGVRIAGRGRHIFVAHFQRVPGKDFAARLVGSVIDDTGRTLKEFDDLGEIHDGQDLAEWLGVTSEFGVAENARQRNQRFRKDLDAQTIYVGDENRMLFSDSQGKFGISLRVAGAARKFEELEEGLAFVRTRPGEEYDIVLYNHRPHEVAVSLKIDGLSSFHFSESAFRNPDGSTKYNYWVVPPRGSVKIGGWYKTSRRQSRFKIAPLEESAVALAGMSLDDVGLITASFHASWAKGSSPPQDEPKFERMVEAPGRKIRVAVEKVLPDGRKVTVYEERVETRMQYATGFGIEEITNTAGLTRVVGVPRATVAFRYQVGE